MPLATLDSWGNFDAATAAPISRMAAEMSRLITRRRVRVAGDSSPRVTTVSTTGSVVPGTQVAPAHVSPTVHALQSVHTDPSGFGTGVQLPVPGLQVP